MRGNCKTRPYELLLLILRRNAMQKQNKTEAAKSKAMKSAKIQAQLKVDQAKLKQRHQNVVRARKTYWFEKFLW